MGLIKFVKEARQEIKKVTWPTRKDTIRYSLMVAVASLIVAAYLGAVDALTWYAVSSYLLN